LTGRYGDLRPALVLLPLVALVASLPSQKLHLPLPLEEGSLRFAVIGDTGTGKEEQFAVAKQIAIFRASFPFEFAIMLGDNLYGRERPNDYVNKFERPCKPLLDAGVKFYAALGNHDEPTQRFYKPFNMNGERYHTFRPKAWDGPFRSVRWLCVTTGRMTWQVLQIPHGLSRAKWGHRA
jgi:hypothetical protein